MYKSFLQHLAQEGVLKVPSNESISDIMPHIHFNLPDDIMDHIMKPIGSFLDDDPAPSDS